MIISSGLLPIYFGSLGFCYILIFTCMLLLHWRKGIQRERRAKAWMEQMKMEWFFHRALSRWTEKEAQTGTKAENCSPESDSISNPRRSFVSSEVTSTEHSNFPSFPGADLYKPVFQEVPCACVLSHLPPLLEHSASYPCSSIPARSTPFSSPLKFSMMKNVAYHDGSSISA